MHGWRGTILYSATGMIRCTDLQFHQYNLGITTYITFFTFERLQRINCGQSSFLTFERRSRTYSNVRIALQMHHTHLIFSNELEFFHTLVFHETTPDVSNQTSYAGIRWGDTQYRHNY